MGRSGPLQDLWPARANISFDGIPELSSRVPNQEIMDGLKLCLQAALKKYQEENHTLPDRIFVLQDGVGDGLHTLVE